MAITFPMSAALFADLMRVRSVTWRLMQRQELSEAGGETLAADLGPALWEAVIETVPMEHAETDQLQAKVEALDGAINTFYLFNPRRSYPQSDPEGSVLGSSTVTILSVGADNKSLALTGLPDNYAITIGDMLAVDYGSPTRRALFRFAASGNANSSGETAELEVRPHVRPGLVAGNAAFLAKPAAKMIMLPNTAEVVELSTIHSAVRFSARQTLRAGG